jgi:hypothetical protein
LHAGLHVQSQNLSLQKRQISPFTAGIPTFCEVVDDLFLAFHSQALVVASLTRLHFRNYQS